MSEKPPSPPAGRQELAFGPTLPAIPTVAPVHVPHICGTALLSIERITRLRITVDNATIEAHALDDRLELSLCPRAHADGLELPAQVGVNVTAEDETDDRGTEEWLELEDARVQKLHFRRRMRGATVIVRVRFADALCERRLVVI